MNAVRKKPTDRLLASAEVYMRGIDLYNIGIRENPYIPTDTRYFMYDFLQRAVLNWLPPPDGKTRYDVLYEPVLPIVSLPDYWQRLITSDFPPDQDNYLIQYIFREKAYE